MDHPLNTEYGSERYIIAEHGVDQILVFVDHSTIEIFINDGEYVMSSRIFPSRDDHMIRMGGKDIDLSIWSMYASVKDDFVI